MCISCYQTTRVEPLPTQVLQVDLTMAKRRKDPFGNRIDEVSRWEATDEITPFSIEDGLGAAISWDLPPAYACIIRSEDPDTGKITERAYRQPTAARKYMANLFLKDHLDVTILTDHAIHAPADQ